MENKRILFTQPDGTIAVIVPAPGATIEQVIKAVPTGAHYEVVDVADVPADRTFRGAWFHDVSPEPQKVGVDTTKAQDITHEMRRAKRTEEFAPLDEIIMKQIPGTSVVDAENARGVIRAKYDAIQVEIDAAVDHTELKAIIDREEL